MRHFATIVILFSAAPDGRGHRPKKKTTSLAFCWEPSSVGDADYSPLVNVGGIVYDAPVIAAAVEDAFINFPVETRTTALYMIRWSRLIR